MCLGFSIRILLHVNRSSVMSSVIGKLKLMHYCNNLYISMLLTHMLARADFGNVQDQCKGCTGATNPCELLYALSSSGLHSPWYKGDSGGMLLCSYNLVASKTNNKVCTCLCHAVLTQQMGMGDVR